MNLLQRWIFMPTDGHAPHASSKIQVTYKLFEIFWPPNLYLGCNIERDGFLHLCTVEADLTSCYAAAPYSTTRNKKGQRVKYLQARTLKEVESVPHYWQIFQYELLILLYETEVHARLRWKPVSLLLLFEEPNLTDILPQDNANSRLMNGPAKIGYD